MSLPIYVEGVKGTDAFKVPAVAVPIVGVVGFLPEEEVLPGIGIKRSNRRLTPKC